MCGLIPAKQALNAKRRRGVIGLARHGAKRRKIAVDEAGIDRAASELVGSAQRGEKRHIGVRPGNQRAVQRIGELIDRGLAARSVGDELGDHRVVVGCDLTARFDAGVDADIFRPLHGNDLAGGRQKTVLGVFGIDARFDGVTIEADLRLRQRQTLAGSNAKLPLHQIESGDRFGDRMLDLQPRVHLDEPERASPQTPCAVGDELDRAGALIADGAGGLDGGITHLRAQFRSHAWRSRLLHDLLVPAL